MRLFLNIVGAVQFARVGIFRHRDAVANDATNGDRPEARPATNVNFCGLGYTELDGAILAEPLRTRDRSRERMVAGPVRRRVGGLIDCKCFAPKMLVIFVGFSNARKTSIFGENSTII